MKIEIIFIALLFFLMASSCEIQRETGKYKFVKEENIKIELRINECLFCLLDPDYKKIIKVKYNDQEFKHVVELSQERDLGIHLGESKLNSDLRLNGINEIAIIRDFYEGCKIIDIEKNKNVSDKYLKSISQYECDENFEKINNQIDFKFFMFFNGIEFYKYSGNFIEEKKKNGTF